VSPKEGDDDGVWREREGKERRVGAYAFQPETRERDGGKGVRCGCDKGREPIGTGMWHLVELWRRRGGGGPAPSADPTPTETGGASRAGAGEGEGKACQWAGLRGAV
jgi:hypothetical protein